MLDNEIPLRKVRIKLEISTIHEFIQYQGIKVKSKCEYDADLRIPSRKHRC